MVELDMTHVMNLAVENKITVNLLKTADIVFHRPNVSHDLLSLVIPNVSQVAVAKRSMCVFETRPELLTTC